ncbi:MAG: SDR family NAD(P)-dependent oxidoreductase [Bacteroidia bacterium]|nr:SDR family NAD(P)-dependent oxidoreductase [Bacteroidia bacterium]
MNTIVVSGANGNLGQAVVLHFLNIGWQVAGLVYSKHSPICEHQHYREFRVDLKSESESEKCVQQLIDIYKKIDAVVMTAGGFRMGEFAHTTLQDLDFLYKLNFTTAYNLSRHLITHLEGVGGKFVFIGSAQGFDTKKGKSAVAYSLSKSHLFQLANIINASYANKDVRACVIVPSIIDTPQNRDDMPNADFSKWEKTEDIARVIADFIYNKITDSVIVVQAVLKQ